jgi:hypothetical protein
MDVIILEFLEKHKEHPYLRGATSQLAGLPSPATVGGKQVFSCGIKVV